MTTVVCYVFVSALAAALGAQEHMRTSWLLLLLQAVPALCWVAPAYAPMRTSRSRAYVSMAALRPGDKVVVIGVTGGVGQLTVARLANEGKYKVRAVGRSAERSKQVLGLDNIEYASADTKELDSLYKPLDDADAVIIATGTSALPSPRWKGGNTPDAVDRRGVKNILAALSSRPRKKQVKKVIFLSSVGTLRSTQLPFSILNLFGVLDAKRDSEEALKSLASTQGFDYVILRPGRLVGGPWTNTDVSALLRTEEGSRKRVVVQRGDEQSGDAARPSVAELVVRCLDRPEAANKDLSLVNQEGAALTSEDWDAIFRRL